MIISTIIPTRGIAFSLHFSPPAASRAPLLVALLVLLPLVTIHELRSRTIPDRVSLLLLALAAFGVILRGGHGPVGTTLAALAGLGVPLVARAVTGGGLGWGDVKLSFSMAVLLGPITWAIAMLAAAAAAAGGVVLDRVVTNDPSSCESGLPFGPYLMAGGIVALVMESACGR